MYLGFTLSKNDMFIMGLHPDEIDLETDEGRAHVIEHLYRVQKIGHNNYLFRKHTSTATETESRDRDSLDIYHIRSLGKLESANPTKVTVDRLGRIQLFSA